MQASRSPTHCRKSHKRVKRKRDSESRFDPQTFKKGVSNLGTPFVHFAMQFQSAVRIEPADDRPTLTVPPARDPFGLDG